MHIEDKVSLRNHTTFKIGGDADFFVTVQNTKELEEALAFARERSLPYTILGKGSNVLVSDEGIRGLVIKIGIEGIEFTDLADERVRLSIGAGVVFDHVVIECVGKGIWGIENLSAIPGSMGATPVQNVGAYGVEIRDVLESVEVYDTKKNESRTLTLEECEFGYRSSVFKTEKGKKYVITKVNLVLTKKRAPKLAYKDLAHFFKDTPEPALIDIRNAVCSIRSKKFPDWRVVGTAGSFFKNPIIEPEKYAHLQKTYPELPGFPDGKGGVKIALGWILDKGLGLRGMCEGSVCTYEGQALVIVNRNTATAHDVTAFAENIFQQVKKVFDIEIEWEVTLLK